MPAYILRHAGTELLADLYAADSLRDLQNFIDEETDPSDYEYSPVPGGYGIRFCRGGRTVPVNVGVTESPGRTLAEAERIALTVGLE